MRHPYHSRPPHRPGSRLALTLWGLVLLLCGCMCQTCDPNKCALPCEERGECSARYTHAGDGTFRCYAADDASCAQSTLCTREGRCYATQVGTCVRREQVAEHTCSRSHRCDKFGECSPSGKGYCWPTEQAHCDESSWCAERGRCTLGSGLFPHACLADEASCARCEECKTRGTCGVRHMSCSPTEQAHCLQSERCSTHQECTFIPGKLIYEGRCVTPQTE